jgi:hypothetical protein
MHDLPPSCVGRHQEDFTNGAFLKFPAGDPVCVEIYERASALGDAIKLGQMSGLVTEAAFRKDSTCTVLPVPAIYPVPWSDTWLLVDPDQRERCEELTTSSHCVHWWNTAITLVMGMPKEALPPVGSYLYEHARGILPESDLSAWPIEVARPWIEGFKRFRPDIETARLAEIERLTKAVGALEATVAAQADESGARLAQLAQDVTRADAERLRLAHELDEVRRRLEEREALVDQLMTSKSWKLTAPLRAVDRLFNGSAR